MNSVQAASRRISPWLQSNRREILELTALAISILVICGVNSGFPVSAALCAGIVTLLVPFWGTRSPGLWGDFVAAVPRRMAAVFATGLFLHYWLAQPLSYLWFGAVWPVAAWAMAFRWSRLRIKNPTVNEVLRVMFLLTAALWVIRGFARHTLNGTGDALWYATVLKDMVLQVRSGVFPVWVGQSIYQFNGAICPVRIAPAFTYIGAFLDQLTFGALGTFALQNLLIAIVAIGAIAGAYLCLCALHPEGRWLAAGLACLFLSCPGVLGLAYNTDLYMSWTTVPLVPFVWFATIRSFQNQGNTRTMVLLGATLGLSCWGHAPIALWSTCLAAVAQCVRLVADWRSEINWKALLSGGGAYGAIAAYPIGSMLLFPAPGMSAQSFALAAPEVIEFFIRQASPTVFLPLDSRILTSGDWQLGYSIWALLILCPFAMGRRWRLEYCVPLALAAVLAFMLLPIPGLCTAIWTCVPAILRNTAGNWAASRLCLPISAATVFGAAAFDSFCGAGIKFHRILQWVVAVGCVWSLSEANKLVSVSRNFARTPESAVDMLRPENVQITRFSYSMFPGFPDNFTHGVTDPELENGFLSRDAMKLISGNAASALTSGKLEAEGELHWIPGGSSDRIAVDRKFRIQPGVRYLLDFSFANPDKTHGVLQIIGDHFFREYELPEHGGPKAFGAGGEHATALPIWTTAGLEDLTVQFFPDPPIGNAQAISVAHVRLLTYDRGALPVRVDSWIPYRASVRSPSEAWLQTPRMYQAGYSALVNDRPAVVRSSRDGLDCIAVPGGDSIVELVYHPPVGLILLFWTSIAGIVGSVACLIYCHRRRAA